MYQIKHTNQTLNIPNQIYDTKPTKQNKTYQKEPFKVTKITATKLNSNAKLVNLNDISQL